MSSSPAGEFAAGAMPLDLSHSASVAWTPHYLQVTPRPSG